MKKFFDKSSDDTHFYDLVKAYLKQHRLALAKQLLEQKLKVRQNLMTLVSGLLATDTHSEELMEMKESENEFNSKEKEIATELINSEKVLEPAAQAIQVEVLQSNHSSIADEVVRKWDALATPIIQRKLIEK